MSLPFKSVANKKEAKSIIQNRATVLNPNAAEFVPLSLRPANGSSKFDEIAQSDFPETSKKGALVRSDSSASHNSDEEARQYWRCQLPDDITPDFTATGLTDEMGYSDSAFPLDQLSVPFTTSAGNSWPNQFVKEAQHLTLGSNGRNLNGSSNSRLVNNSFIDKVILEDSVINHVEFLALQFPGFSADSLAEVYYANACDLNLTIEILTQLELQMDGGFTPSRNLKPMATSNLNALDFPALPAYTGGNIQPTTQDLHRSPSSIFREAPDFASAVRKLASLDNDIWKHESAQLLNNSYKGIGKLAHERKLQAIGANRMSPLWLETGDVVANMYSTSREEARDFARLRNACFQQAREAYLIGNKALAKELGNKGKYYNLQMKEAHSKAREAIYRQRNPVSLELPGYGRGQERLIDLHGLHVNEAILVLKHELSVLRNAVRSGGQHLQVLICVGTGHHTKGARTPARLPIAVEQYLLDEGLHYTQSQPGLLRVVIF